jgi:hypothetical protein
MFSGRGVQVWQVGHLRGYYSARFGVQHHMRRFVVAATLALGLLALTPENALACSCVPVKGKIDYREFLKRFPGAVFEGTLVRQEEMQTEFGTELKLTYRVERHWTGITSSQVVVYTHTDSSMCGVGAEPTVSRFIIATQGPMGLETGICHYVYVQDRKAFRAAVGEGSPPPKK